MSLLLRQQGREFLGSLYPFSDKQTIRRKGVLREVGRKAWG